MSAAVPDRVSGTRAQRVQALVAVESLIRRLQGLSLQVIADMAVEVDDTLGKRSVADVMADELRLVPADARSRVKLAAHLTDRVSIQGEPLPPAWENLAKLVHIGVVGGDHLGVAREFFRHLSTRIDVVTRDFCEAKLAEWAAEFRPDEMRKLAIELEKRVNPDGDLADESERARKRHFTVNKQGVDKMTSGRFCLEPETAAVVEAWLAKFARKGMCVPESDTSDGEPSPETIAADTRTYGQRCHDAFAAAMRSALNAGDAGRHRGLPVTIVLNADIRDFDAGAPARTPGGVWVPAPDAARMGEYATNYLALFDGAEPLELFHGRDRRLATPAQRLMLLASDRGCTYPSCPKGGYDCQVHHANGDWQHGGRTDITDLALVCDKDHPLAGHGPGQWRTRKRGGVTEWIPPKSIDPQQKPRVNQFHHPERRAARQGPDDPEPG